MLRKTLCHGYCSHFTEEDIEAQNVAQVDGVNAEHVETQGVGVKTYAFLAYTLPGGLQGCGGAQSPEALSWLYMGPLCSGLWDPGAGPVGIPCQLARAE